MAVRLPLLPSIKEIIGMYKLHAQKQLSQNFLLDMNLTRKIVRSAGKISGGYVCEVGPGPGGITRAVLEHDVQEVSVIEKDTRFLPGLQMLAEATNHKLKIYHGDALRFQLDDLFPKETVRDWHETSPNIHIIGNLPFNVSTPLIIKWLEAISNKSGAWRYGRTKLTLTFQKEVAERMVASICSKDRCRLSVICQNYCDVTLKFIIPGKAFVPAPKVDVGVVHFVPRKEPQISLPFKLIEKVVRHVCHYRNKKCIRGIETLFPPDMPELTAEMMEESEIDPACRSFMLSVGEYGKLCHAYKRICDRLPNIYEFDFRSTAGVALMRQKRMLETEKIEKQILENVRTSEIPAR